MIKFLKAFIRFKVGVFISLLFLSAFSCKENTQTNTEGSAMLVKEINSRLLELENKADSLKKTGIDPSAIHSRFQELLLMSKDVENLQASVNLHKTYLDEVCQAHGLNRSQLLEINSSMDLEQIDLIFKQNELQLLNQVWMRKLEGNIKLETVK